MFTFDLLLFLSALEEFFTSLVKQEMVNMPRGVYHSALKGGARLDQGAGVTVDGGGRGQTPTPTPPHPTQSQRSRSQDPASSTPRGALGSPWPHQCWMSQRCHARPRYHLAGSHF